MDSDALGWVWKTELETHRRLLALARSQLQQLERCIKGEKVMDRSSLQLSQLLQSGQVPEEWSGKNIQKTIEEFLDVCKIRAEFYKVKNHPTMTNHFWLHSKFKTLCSPTSNTHTRTQSHPFTLTHTHSHLHTLT